VVRGLLLLLLLSPLTIPAWAMPPWEGPLVIHTVRQGETLAGIARLYGVSVESLVELNGLSNPNIIVAGQRLLIPRSGELPSPWRTITLSSNPVTQGKTLLVKVRRDDGAAPEGSFEGQRLRFVRGEDGFWALVGVHALAKPGIHFLRLKGAGLDEEALLVPFVVREGDYEVEYIRLPPSRAILLTPEVLKQEREVMQEALSRITPYPRWEGLFALPLRGQAPITSPFGQRRSYNGAPPRSYHEGVDFGVPKGTPVYAPAAGRVVLARALKVRGNAVIIDHGVGVMSGYWHLERIAVKEGQLVEQGDLLGWVGNTGLSTGAHLHWEIRVNGVNVDPLQWTMQEIGEPASRTPLMLNPLLRRKIWLDLESDI